MQPTFERPADLGEGSEALARRWKLELKLSGKREANWRRKAADVCKQYTPENPAANSFNVLWTNTETLRQACYNSLPQPLVRRRYHDDDPIGKGVSQALQRSLEYCQDAYDFHGAMQGDVLSMLLPGRALSRVRYVPSLTQVGTPVPDEQAEEPTHEAQEGAYEELAWEQVIVERVQWDKFRIGPGKSWDDVTWIAFCHDLSREDLVDKFGEDIGNAIPLDEVADEDVKRDADMEPLFRTGEVWEVWDKDERKVIWISLGYPKPLKVQDDPLGLLQFWPCPRPLYAIERPDSLVPVCLYAQYEQQAKELNRISTRINKLVEALRVRGVYDATLTELSQLMKLPDNELVPAENATVLLERGGLEKAIWMMPIDQAAMVLAGLYQQREQTKAVIYEITGIADIMRAASDPAETFGAQKIKTTWGTQRLQRMQAEIQRYIRDLIRLKAEIIAEKFQPETIQAMTMLNLPTEQDVMQAQMAGQQVDGPTWEQVIEGMRNESSRSYRIDIETDSTLSATQDNDTEALATLLGGITQLVQGLGPAVQAGAIPVEAVKEIILVACRRAKLGSAVEDALDKVQAPAPQADPAEAARMAEEAKAQAEQAKMEMQAATKERELQAQAQLEQFKAQLSAETEQAKQESQAREQAHTAELDAQREALRIRLESEAEQRREAFERWKAELDASTKIVIAELSAGAREPGEGQTPKTGALSGMLSETVRIANGDVMEKLGQTLAESASQQAQTTQAMLATINALIQQMGRPKRIVRGADGRAVGVE